MRSIGFSCMAAFLEISGCFAFWASFRLGRSLWWILAGAVTLAFFAVCLTRIDASYAGRAFAAYGGIYIASSLAWLWMAEGIKPDRWDAAGAVICLVGASVILWGPRT